MTPNLVFSYNKHSNRIATRPSIDTLLMNLECKCKCLHRISKENGLNGLFYAFDVWANSDVAKQHSLAI